jgi:hypothetical protein
MKWIPGQIPPSRLALDLENDLPAARRLVGYLEERQTQLARAGRSTATVEELLSKLRPLLDTLAKVQQNVQRTPWRGTQPRGPVPAGVGDHDHAGRAGDPEIDEMIEPLPQLLSRK